MTDLNLEEFVKHVFKGGPLPPFEPSAWYNDAGDSLEIFLNTRPYVAQRIDGVFTLLLDRDDHNRVVGIVIKQIKKNFCTDGIQTIDINAKHARLELLILTAVNCGYIVMSRKQPAPPVPEEIYDLLRNAGKTQVKIENLERAFA